MSSPEATTGVSPAVEPPKRASQACLQCSRLKRRCQRELPACFLCTRLGKTCEYPAGRKPYGSGRSSEVDTTAPVSPSSAGGDSASKAGFPDAFFLDREMFSPIPHVGLKRVPAIPTQVSQLLGADYGVICQNYFETVDTWFPIISKKRLRQSMQGTTPTEATSVVLLLLCMRLIVDEPRPGNSTNARSTLYREAKGHLLEVENLHPLSLHVFQSLVLIALYEAGHGIFPAAYLTVGQAARVAVLRGLYDRRNATQLFQAPPTWSYWEEERRAWWATLILERYINIGPQGLPLATPEPVHGELLPTSDADWYRGSIGTNPALYVGSFSSDTDIGPFARACQASHMLGRVIQHRDGRKDNYDRRSHLIEALQLHSTLLALDAHLSGPMDSRQDGMVVSTVDVALCTSARFILYHMYACNEPDSLDERHHEETVLQAACIDGVKQILTTRLQSLVRHITDDSIQQSGSVSNPFVAQCVYDAASECQWLLREGEEAIEGAPGVLALLTDALHVLAKRWHVAEKYIALLEQSN